MGNKLKKTLSFLVCTFMTGVSFSSELSAEPNLFQANSDLTLKSSVEKALMYFAELSTEDKNRVYELIIRDKAKYESLDIDTIENDATVSSATMPTVVDQ